MTITTQSPCSSFPSGNYSPGLQIFHTNNDPLGILSTLNINLMNLTMQHQSTGSRLQPLRGDPDNLLPGGTNATDKASTPKARSPRPSRAKDYFYCISINIIYRCFDSALSIARVLKRLRSANERLENHPELKKRLSGPSL